MSRWLHAYKLMIGSPIPISSITSSTTGSFTSVVDINANIQKSKDKANAYILTEHQISFNITKDTTKETNLGTITIVNAGDDLVNYIASNVKNNVAVVLQAGYTDEVKTIFTGTVVRLSDKKEGTDRLTELACRDGAVNITEAVSTRAYPKGTPYKNIIKDLSGDLGSPVGVCTIDSDTTTTKTVGPVHYVGSTHKALGGIAKSLNHNYSIQDGAVFFTPKTKKLPAVSVYISESSGLIGSPEPLTLTEGIATKKPKANSTSTKKKKTPQDGIKFKCQLDGAILPEKTIWVKSDDYDVGMKVTKVVHSGSYEGNDWTTSVECVYV